MWYNTIMDEFIGLIVGLSLFWILMGICFLFVSIASGIKCALIGLIALGITYLLSRL
jgi:hypothetical protein